MLVNGIASASVNMSASSINLSCVSCGSLAVMGNFSSLTVLSLASTRCSTVSVSASCTNCGALTTLGSFDSLQSLSSGNSQGSASSLSLSCSSCGALVSFGEFPSLFEVRQVTSTDPNDNEACTGTDAITLSCTNCAQLSAFATFGGLTSLTTADASNYTSQATISATCSSCAALASFGSFASLGKVTGNTAAGVNAIASGSISLACHACSTSSAGAVVGNFGALINVVTDSSIASIAIAVSDSLVNSVGVFSNMYSVSTGPTSLGSVAINCTNCTIQGGLGQFDTMQVLMDFSDSSWNSLASVSLACSTCTFPSSAASPFGSFSGLQYVSYQSIVAGTFGIFISCDKCSGLSSLAVFPGVLGVNTELVVSCTNCPNLSQFAVFDSLNNVAGNQYWGSASFTCSNCGNLTTFGSFIIFDYVSEGGASVLSSLSLSCTNCPLLITMGSFPSMSSIANGAQAVGAMTIACSTCDVIGFFAYMPKLSALADPAGFAANGSLTIIGSDLTGVAMLANFTAVSELAQGCSGSLSVSCTNCPDLEVLGALESAVAFVDQGGAVSVSLSCTTCDGLKMLGYFPIVVTIADTATANVSLSCIGCPDLVSLGVLTGLQTMTSTSASSAVQLAVSCTDCSSLPVVGVLSDLGNLNGAQSASFSCINCPSLVAIGQFDQVVSLGATAPTAVSVNCTNCPAVTNIGTFASLPTVFGSISVNCNQCNSLTAFGVFGALTTVANTFSGSIAFNCTTCPSLESAGQFPALTASTTTSQASIVPVSSISFSCNGCSSASSASVSFGNFSALQTVVGALGGSATITLSCTVCNYFPYVGVFSSLVSINLANTMGALSVTCNQCSSLYGLALTPLLRAVSVGPSSPSSLYVSCTTCNGPMQSVGLLSALQAVSLAGSSASLSIQCMTCPNITSVGTFTALQAAAVSIVTPSSAVTLSVACTSCDLLTSLGVFGTSFTGIAYGFATSGSATVSILCTTCPAIVSVSSTGSLVSLSSNGSATGAVSASWYSGCSNCPLVTGLGDFSSLVNLSDSSAPNSKGLLNVSLGSVPTFSTVSTSSFPLVSPSDYASIVVACNECAPVFNALLPITYDFSGPFTFTFGTIADNSSLILHDSSTVSAAFEASVTSNCPASLNSITLNNVAMTTADMFVNVVTISNQLTVVNNKNLASIDGLTVNLAYLGSVLVDTSNPVLCFIQTTILSTAVGAKTVASPASNCPPIVLNLPAVPTVIALASVSVSLAWTNVEQPSVAVQYQLWESGSSTVVAVFKAYEPAPASFVVHSLDAERSYSFYLKITYSPTGGITDSDQLAAQTNLLTVTTTASGSGSCDAGQASANGGCTTCPSGTFVGSSGLVCASCVAGTSSSIMGTSFSSNCLPCPAGQTTNGLLGQTSCVACGANAFCPFGAAASLASAVNSTTASSSVLNQATSNSSADLYLSVGWLCIVAYAIFLVVFLIAATVLYFCTRFTASVSWFVGGFSTFMRTPRWNLKVSQGKKDTHVEDPSDFSRGILAIWMIAGVIVISAYQIYNFVETGFAASETLQPGTIFSDGTAIATAPTQLAATVILLASPVLCTSAFSIVATLGADTLTSNCTQTAKNNVTIAFSMPASASLPLTSTSIIDFALTITAAEGNLVYAPVIAYTFTGLQFDGTSLSLTETIAASAGQLITGSSTVALAGVASEEVTIGGDVSTTGYAFSYISSAPAMSAQPSTSLSINFQINVPAYYLREQQVQVISWLSFFSNLLALAGGVIAVISVVAFIFSLCSRRFWKHWDKKEQANDLPPEGTFKGALIRRMLDARKRAEKKKAQAAKQEAERREDKALADAAKRNSKAMEKSDPGYSDRRISVATSTGNRNSVATATSTKRNTATGDDFFFTAHENQHQLAVEMKPLQYAADNYRNSAALYPSSAQTKPQESAPPAPVASSDYYGTQSYDQTAYVTPASSQRPIVTQFAAAPVPAQRQPAPPPPVIRPASIATPNALQVNQGVPVAAQRRPTAPLPPKSQIRNGDGNNLYV